MSAPRPIHLWIGLTSLVGVAACAAWALWPLQRPAELRDVPADAPQGQVTPEMPRLERIALDTAAFRAPLWLAPPPLPPKAAPQPAPPPPPPLRLQLVGIVVEEGASKAVLYDPDTDVLHIVAAGQPVGRCTVETVTAAGVTLREGELLRTLALREDGPSQGARR